MGLEPKVDEILTRLAARFFERIIKDISSATWVRILSANPILKREVLEGFSLQPGKFSRMILQPLILGRLRRKLQQDATLFGTVLAEWKEEQAGLLSCLAMLDLDFLSENWKKIRDLFGPERFCIGLFALGLLERERFARLPEDGDFWSDEPDERVFDILVPILYAWGGFIEKHPDLARKFLESEQGSGFAFELEGEESGRKASHDPELQERFRKVEKKLEKSQLELSRAGEQLAHLRGENEESRKKLKELESDFDRKVAEAVVLRRKQWFERYQYLDRESASREAERLEPLLHRTMRALELQKHADEEYGLVSDIRAKSLEIDLALAKIESVYADSLVVHKEVEKVKEALLNEKNRLLKLPGIRKIISRPHEGGMDLIGGINLLDPIAANLPKVNKLQKMVDGLADLGLISDAALVKDSLRHKKRQIMELLYSQFEPGRELIWRERAIRDFEDFIESGESRRYDLFIDGYNVLLRLHGEEKDPPRRVFTQLREQFIEAVVAKGGHFARVYLVFDGVEDSRLVQGNTEIIYTNKSHDSADTAIISRISKRKDGRILLVTADNGIISAVQGRLFALIDPIDFYMFVFE